MLKLEAEDSLKWYRGPDYDITQEINEIINKKEDNQVKFFSMASKPINIR